MSYVPELLLFICLCIALNTSDPLVCSFRGRFLWGDATLHFRSPLKKCYHCIMTPPCSFSSQILFFFLQLICILAWFRFHINSNILNRTFSNVYFVAFVLFSVLFWYRRSLEALLKLFTPQPDDHWGSWSCYFHQVLIYELGK